MDEKIHLLTTLQLISLLQERVAKDTITRAIFHPQISKVDDYPFLTRITVNHHYYPFDCHISKTHLTAPFVLFTIMPQSLWKCPEDRLQALVNCFQSVSRCNLFRVPTNSSEICGEFSHDLVDAHNMSFIFGLKLLETMHGSGLL